jgi:hypothetical protein
VKTLAPLLIVLFAAPDAGRRDYELRTWKKIQLSDVFTCEGAAVGDFNHDGKMDVVAGPWWYEGPDFTKKHEYYPVKTWKPDNEYSNNFFAFVYDFNKDGWDDILIYGFPGADASWFENPKGKDGHWERHEIFKVVDNESPTFVDVNGDGIPDIVCSTGGRLGYVTIADGKFHPISPKKDYQRFTHGLGVGDVNGDGKMDILESRGWYEQPKSLEGDPEWTFHPVNFGKGGAQMYAYDVNGDGLPDVITSIQAHGYGLSWFEQQKDGTFKEHVIVGKKEEENPYGIKFSQMHAIDLVDIDGDGLKDIVTGKRWMAHGSKGDAEPLAPAVLYWFKLVRGKDGSVDWIPNQIDNDSGIGTQVMAADVNGDKHPDIIVGNKKGAFVHLQQVKKVSKEEWEKAQPKKITQ